MRSVGTGRSRTRHSAHRFRAAARVFSPVADVSTITRGFLARGPVFPGLAEHEIGIPALKYAIRSFSRGNAADAVRSIRLNCHFVSSV